MAYMSKSTQEFLITIPMKPNKVFALISRTCSPHFAVVKRFLATLLTEYPVRTAQIGILGTACTMMELGGMWI